ncbi:MAG: serine protein kinase RIO [Candidatus Heimdallarchaeaceae archaeon]
MNKTEKYDVRHLDAKIDKSRIRTKDEKALQVIESVFDEQTALLIVSLMNKGIIKEISHVVSTGKEANVYHAYGENGKELAIKIYRTTTNIFKQNWRYLEGDPRFKRYKKGTYSFIYLWAKKEFKNLQRMSSIKIAVPSPIIVRKNVLVMDFIGKKREAAPLLKDVKIRNKRKGKIYSKMVDYISKLHNEGKMVHADLSEYNILYYNKEPVIIDVSQAVLLDHPNAYFFLYRDISNINRFFGSIGVDVLENDELFEHVTGFKPDPKIKIEL